MEKLLRGVALLVILAVLFGALFLALDTPLGSTRETTGVVKDTTVMSSKKGRLRVGG